MSGQSLAPVKFHYDPQQITIQQSSSEPEHPTQADHTKLTDLKDSKQALELLPARELVLGQQQAQTEWEAIRRQFLFDQVDAKSTEFKDLETKIPSWSALDRLKFLKHAMEMQFFALISYLVDKKALDVNVKAKHPTVSTGVMGSELVIAMDFETQRAALDLKRIWFLIQQGSKLGECRMGIPFFQWQIAPLALETLSAFVRGPSQLAAESKEPASKADPALQSACTWLVLYAWERNITILSLDPSKTLKDIFSCSEAKNLNPNIKRLEIAYLARKLKKYSP